jgi:hypothetical protein
MNSEKEAKGSLPIEHSVEGCNLVNTHWRHLKELCNVVHDIDTCPSFVLPLAEVKERDNCCLFILRRIPRDDFFRALHVLWSEPEGNLEVYIASDGARI